MPLCQSGIFAGDSSQPVGREAEMRNGLSRIARQFLRSRKARVCFYALTLLSATLVFLLAPQKTSAVTRTWDGGGVDNNWDTADNWNPDGAPTGGDTVIFDGTSIKDATIMLNRELYTLLFAGGRKAVTLGEATRRAKAAVSNTDIRRSWILFGDPTMTLK